MAARTCSLVGSRRGGQQRGRRDDLARPCRSRTAARPPRRTRAAAPRARPRRRGPRSSSPSQPSACTASRMQESIARPSTSTVQAPQVPSSQAIFVPVRPTCSRSSSASVAPSGTAARCSRAVERERDLAHASTVSAWAALSSRNTRPAADEIGRRAGHERLCPLRPQRRRAAHELGLLLEALLVQRRLGEARGIRRARACPIHSSVVAAAMYIVARTRAYEVRYSARRERRRAPLGPAPLEQAAARCRRSIPRSSSSSAPLRRAARSEHVERGERLAVRDVGGPQDLLRRHQREQVELVERRPGRAVEEDVLDVPRQLADAGLGDDRGVRQDQRGVGVPLGDVAELAAACPAAGRGRRG